MSRVYFNFRSDGWFSRTLITNMETVSDRSSAVHIDKRELFVIVRKIVLFNKLNSLRMCISRNHALKCNRYSCSLKQRFSNGQPQALLVVTRYFGVLCLQIKGNLYTTSFYLKEILHIMYLIWTFAEESSSASRKGDSPTLLLCCQLKLTVCRVKQQPEILCREQVFKTTGLLHFVLLFSLL